MRSLTGGIARATCIVAATASVVSLRSVRVEPVNQDGTTRVIIEANGPLPQPSGEALADPPRIYLDFADVLPPPSIDAISHPAIARVRVAEHSSNPLVTRVVLDLIRGAQYRVDASARAQGRVVVIIGAGAAASTNLYAKQVSAALVRLQALRPSLQAIDRREETIPGDLAATATEFDDVAKLLNGVKPPSSRASTHALLVRTCTLGARAARLRQTARANQDVASSWDAASAAAGALMILERASGDLMRK